MRSESIEVRQQKTGARLLLPIHPKLKAELAQADSKHLTFIVTEYGAPFSVAGFGGWFSDAARAAGLSDRSLHGLRKTAARRLAEAGCSTKQIAAVTGHASLREVERYTPAASQEQLARNALEKLVGEGSTRGGHRSTPAGAFKGTTSITQRVSPSIVVSHGACVKRTSNSRQTGKVLKTGEVCGNASLQYRRLSVVRSNTASHGKGMGMP
jgi:hypothetical protein